MEDEPIVGKIREHFLRCNASYRFQSCYRSSRDRSSRSKTRSIGAWRDIEVRSLTLDKPMTKDTNALLVSMPTVRRTAARVGSMGHGVVVGPAVTYDVTFG
jgi:hypothetical protein